MPQLGPRQNTGQAAEAVAANKTFHFEEREKRTSRTRICSYAQKQKTSEKTLPWLRQRKSRPEAKREIHIGALVLSLYTLRRRAALE
jgi:hypothetical protein